MSTEEGRFVTRSSFSSIYRLKNGEIRKDIDYKGKGCGFLSTFEVELLSRARHPYLIPANGVSVNSDCVSLYLPGADYDLLDGINYGLSDDELILFFYQISLALFALHKEKIAHLDIKPDNILIFREKDGKLVARLADLGFARYLPQPQRQPNAMGTPLYLPPEFARSIAEDCDVIVDLSSDLWSLGFTFYMLISKDFKYDEDNGKPLSFSKLYRKNCCLWLTEERSSNHPINQIKEPIIRRIIDHLLTSVEKRWNIEQVISAFEEYYQEKAEPRYTLTFSEVSLSDSLSSYLHQACHFLNLDLKPLEIWLRRLVSHLNLDLFRLSEIAPVLLYLVLSYNGYSQPLNYYLSNIISSMTEHRFIEVEKEIFLTLYPRPMLMKQEQHKLQQDEESTDKHLQV